MDTLLDALQEGRLIELPDTNKENSFRFLAHIIEAIPSLPAGLDVVSLVMERERSADTSLTKGWACPHARVPFEEDLFCVVGWSPNGIDYGARDGHPVSIIIMYLVPDNQRNHYLREVSLLAKAITIYPGMEKLNSAKELNEIRDHLLDLISSTKETVGPDSRARIIQLQTRPSLEILPVDDLSNLVVEPVTLISGHDIRHIALSQNAELSASLDTASGLVEKLESSGTVHHGGWKIIKRGKILYQHGRIAYDCLAIRKSDTVKGKK